MRNSEADGHNVLGKYLIFAADGHDQLTMMLDAALHIFVGIKVECVYDHGHGDKARAASANSRQFLSMDSLTINKLITIQLQSSEKYFPLYFFGEL